MTSNTETPTNPNTTDYPEIEELSAAWEAYAAIWKMDGAEAKLEACAQSLDPACVYTDPLTQRQGWDDLVAYMVDFHQQVPGGHFVTTEFSAHHGRSMVRWNMVTGEGAVVGDGVSYGEYAPVSDSNSNDSDSGDSNSNASDSNDSSGRDHGLRVKIMTGFFETPA